MHLSDLNAILADLGDLALPTLVIAILSTAAVLLALRRLRAQVAGPLLLFPMAFAVLGGISGVIVGSSMEPLVGGLVTGVLGLVSALLSYAFVKESDEGVRAVIPAIVILLLVNALAGLSVGQNWKKKWINYSDEKEEYRLEYKELWIPTTRDYRKAALERCLAENPKLADTKRNCDVETLFPR
jgi:uncharacterized membrane protein